MATEPDIFEDDDLDDEALQQKIAAKPVLPDMRHKRDLDFAVNKKGEVWIVYDKPFDSPVNWMEYDDDDARLTLVLQNGKIQDLGKAVPAKMRRWLKRSKMAVFAQMENKKLKKLFPVTVTIRETGL
jgi:hypothetical protein